MKNYIKLSLVLLFLCGFMELQAQVVKETVSKQNQSSASLSDKKMDPALPDDPQFAVETAGKDNPSRPDPALLPPVPGTEKEPVDIKAADDMVNPETSKQVETPNTSVNSEQESGIQPDNTINYRKVNGPNHQPESKPEIPVTDYSKLQGPQEQPKGEKPKK